MKILSICLLLLATSVAYAEADTNIYLKSDVFSLNGTTNNYIEVLKEGSNHLASITQTSKGREIGFWFEQNRALSMMDTNNDGRTDRFTFMTDYIPTMVFTRGENNELIPISDEELKKMQDFARVMSSEFPKVIDAAKSSNENLFWGTISNIVNQRDEESQQSVPGYPPQGVGSPEP